MRAWRSRLLAFYTHLLWFTQEGSCVFCHSDKTKQAQATCYPKQFICEAVRESAAGHVHVDGSLFPSHQLNLPRSGASGAGPFHRGCSAESATAPWKTTWKKAEGFQGLRQQNGKKETVNDTAFTTTDRFRLGGSAPSQSRPPSKPTRLAWILVIGLRDLAGLKNPFSVTLFRNRGNGWRDLIDGEPPRSAPPRVLPFFQD